MVAIDLDRLAAAFGPPEGSVFFGVLDPLAAGFVEFAGGAYAQVETVTVPPAALGDLLARTPGLAHVLCISAVGPFESPPASLLGHRRLGVMPFFSTGFSEAKLAAAVALLNGTDFHYQERESARVLALLRRSSRLVFRSPEFDTEATLLLVGSGQHVFRQAGTIPAGGQSVLPGGEISLLTNAHGEFEVEARHPLSGRIPLAGQPIVHRGRCPCAAVRLSRATGRPPSCAVMEPPVDDARLLSTFETMREICQGDLVVEVDDGIIVKVVSSRRSRPRLLFEQLLARDERYRKVHEIGIGINPSDLIHRRDNFMPNEMRRGLHIGLGLTPFTEFHIDVATRDVRILAVSAGSETAVV